MPLLASHPATPAPLQIAADAARPAAGRLELSYLLTGDIAGLVLPAPAPQTRADDLWRATCFEAFFRPAVGDSYTELNLAPSRAWAAYQFDSYRVGMRAADIVPPQIEVEINPGRIALRASFDLKSYAGPWRLALSAVLEHRTGAKSYWALAHPPGAPDFHHAAGFTLDLAEPA